MQLEQASQQAEPDTAAVAPDSANGALTLPDDALIIVPVRNMVLFPGMILPVTIGRGSSIAGAQQAIKSERAIGVLLQRNPEAGDPTPEELFQVGTLTSILRYITTPDGAHHIICQGQQRFRVIEMLTGYPFLVARVAKIEEAEATGTEIEARFLQLQERALEVLQLTPQASQELVGAVRNIASAAALADMVAGLMDIKPAEKQTLLETVDLQKRLDSVLELLAQRLQVLRLSREIDERTKASMDERQREYLLREQLKSIQNELGEGEEGNAAELSELKQAIADAQMPEEVHKQASKELKRLARMSDASAEYSMIRTYLDWLIELPWKAPEASTIDIPEAKRILGEDHFGLEMVKKRILEFLAVRKLNPDGHGPILCFVGPPGVGKTSLGQSIAKATGRAFQRVALGGLHDEAEIRGHRRTYVGALPGNIVQAIRRAASRTGVIMLDEIDKVGSGGFHGDPASALLEVLDPEQNGKFRDNYLGVDFDLSRVMFIATANQLDTIPGPLRDRMEIIQLPGYTASEKIEIARRYLVKRQLDANGLTPDQASVSDAVLSALVHDYTREAGVRNLERELGSVLRSVAMKVAEGKVDSVAVDEPDLHAILGAKKFEDEVALRTAVPGVATGLAWTPVGGDILFIEATRVPGSGKLMLTGQLGDVMKESAQAALTLAKSKLGEALEKWDLHVHVPAGATPKDGPSAGVAMFLSIVSLLVNKPVRNDVAMTGEISLRGLVMPIGGLKEKILAAQRAGITTIMIPRRNAKDLEDVPAEARDTLKFVLLDTVDDALRCAVGIEPEDLHDGFKRAA